ncbi:peroxidase family protein [Actinoplanes sp. NPDC089786]|uniref:peroxidase family protein n=1 Tax=Actinoplanes sp. NPDC089786 TaxID=3155185 RepID=UPI00342CEF14
MTTPWTETYLDGSPEAEHALFEQIVRKILRVQVKNAAGGPILRGFQAKGTFVTEEASLRFADDLAPDLRVGFAQPGATYPAMVRFSNSEGRLRDDRSADMRGVAMRITVASDEQHDLTMTSGRVGARNAKEFAPFAAFTAGTGLSRVLSTLRLPFVVGPRAAIHMLRSILRSRVKISSVTALTYATPTPIRWGDNAVLYLLRPVADTAPAPAPPSDDPDFLTAEMVRRLAGGNVRFELCVQRFRDPKSTPIEDGSVDWSAPSAPPEVVAVLTIPRGTRPSAVNPSFNPWNTTEEFRPLGNLNRLRRFVYDASAAHRNRERFVTDVPLRNTVFAGLFGRIFGVVNRFVPWHRVPGPLALLNLSAFRDVLRRDNLIDTEAPEAPPRVRKVPPGPTDAERAFRTHDGSSNDLSDPRMGAVGAAFGRNMPADPRTDRHDTPNPITVSRELLRREEFIPATSLNILAATWIQFQVHDWVVHRRHKLGVDDVHVPLPSSLPGWANTPGGPLEPTMRIGGNIALPNGAFANVASHWWDGSEVYGTSIAAAQALRDGAKLRLTSAGYLPTDVSGAEVTGFNEAWWTGLGSLHTLFAREHNVLCDELLARNPGWDEERIYQTARLIVAALIAKIHTVEWTPAILATDTLYKGMNINWSGVPSSSSEWLTRFGVWLTDVHALHGIPHTTPDHHAAPYSLTEDFVTVYRMHPLLPDDFSFGAAGPRGLADLLGAKADDELRAIGLTNVLHSFGTAHPGAITLHNYPRTLMNLEREGELIDLSVVDLVRSRRRGVPRYNDFRAGLHMPRITRWEDLSANPDTVRRLRGVYRTIDEVDTMVGMFAETPPAGFGFSDTAFRVFILMASRRLQSDRFLTVDYRPEIYTQFGLDWVEQNTMSTVIKRHCPTLAPPAANAFAPW